MRSRLHWSFPILRPHAGPLLGNGVQGLMVWGADRELRITVGRAGFWDHRGGNDFSSAITFPELRRMLEAGDEEGLRRAFGRHVAMQKSDRPQQFGAGRIELTLPAGCRLDGATLDLERAELALTVKTGSGGSVRLVLRQAVDREWFALDLPRDWSVTARWLPASAIIGAEMAALGIEPATTWQEAGGGGWVQELPADQPLAGAWRLGQGRLIGTTALGVGAEAAARTLLDADAAAIAAGRERWWADYWRDLPRIVLPDPVLQEVVDYGLYKQGCSTPPQGLACSLQGPFLEDYQIPPWSCDYHFNINIQMIYWPALASGRWQHFGPLWDLLRSWWPRLSANAAAFFGDRDAMMLPHAVDDRCQAVGTFWSGTIDHACTAWMAQLAWLHFRYSGDDAVLREVAWPLLRGAFAGYRAMLEEVPDGAGGKRWSLPVSVSPEFRGCLIDAWGRDASFQLAALHMLCQILPQAARAVGAPIDPIWADVAQRLPPYALVEAHRTREYRDHTVRRIGLWEGQDLDDSHRHHSHLGALYPFCTIDPTAAEHAQAVQESLFHWTRMGAGAWSGWCVSWAAIINARCGRSDAAIAWLHWWSENFVNEGRGTLHDAAWPGTSTIAVRQPWPGRDDPNTEIMQLDAGFGALTAVFELLVQCRADGIHVLPGLSHRWRSLDFDGLRAEGGFVIGATVANGRISAVRVRAERAGQLRLHHGLCGSWTCAGRPGSGEVLVGDLAAGDSLVLLAESC